MDELDLLLEERNRLLEWAAWYEKRADRVEQRINELTEGEI